MTKAFVGKFTTNAGRGCVALAGTKDGAAVSGCRTGDLEQGKQDSCDCHPEPRAGFNALISIKGIDMTIAFSVKYYKMVKSSVDAQRKALSPSI
jgi:hypothetical protein